MRCVRCVESGPIPGLGLGTLDQCKGPFVSSGSNYMSGPEEAWDGELVVRRSEIAGEGQPKSSGPGARTALSRPHLTPAGTKTRAQATQPLNPLGTRRNQSQSSSLSNIAIPSTSRRQLACLLATTTHTLSDSLLSIVFSAWWPYHHLNKLLVSPFIIFTLSVILQESRTIHRTVLRWKKPKPSRPRLEAFGTLTRRLRSSTKPEPRSRTSCVTTLKNQLCGIRSCPKHTRRLPENSISSSTPS